MWKTSAMRAAATAAMWITCQMAIAQSHAPGDGNRLLLTTYWGDDVVALIDTEAEAGREELWRIDVAKAAGCLKPYDVRVNTGGSQAFVSCSGENIIIAIDVPAQQVQYVVETGLAPRDLVLFDDDQKLLVANSGNDTASVIDVKSRRKLYDFPVETQPYGVAVTDGGKVALVTGWASGDLHIVSLGDVSAETRAVVHVGLLPYTVVVPPGQDKAYVAVNADDEVVVVDVAGEALERAIPVGRGPWSLTASLDGEQILVTNNRSNSLSQISSKNYEEEPDTLVVGSQVTGNGTVLERRPKNISISADGKKAAFTDLAGDEIVVVDLIGGEIRHAIKGGKAPYGIEFLR